jgi:hypothetical protein
MAQSEFDANRCRRAVLWFVLLPALSVAADPPTTAGDQNSDLEKFKNFISSPPTISNLVFQQKVPMGGGARPLDGSFALSTSFEYFQARWQPGALLFRKFANPAEVTNVSVATQLVWHFDHQHWLFDGLHARLETWTDSDPTTSGKSSSVLYSSDYYLSALNEVMNMGVMNVGMGAIRWHGLTFRLETKVDDQTVIITGQLDNPGSGPPRQLKVNYVFPKQQAEYVVCYGYSPGLRPLFLPSTITNFWASEGKLIELDEWRILELETNETPLAADTFDINPFLQEHPWPVRVYTNGVVYERSTNGTLTLIQLLTSHDRATFWTLHQRSVAFLVFYVVWGGLNIGFFTLVRRVKSYKPQCPQ